MKNQFYTVFKNYYHIMDQYLSVSGHQQAQADLTAEEMVQAGVDHIRRTPLHRATKDKSKHHLIPRILQLDPQVNVKDVEHNTPVHIALLSGCSIDILESLLLAGSDVTICGQFGRNGLHCAAYGRCDFPVFKRLLQYREVVNKIAICGETPLQNALCFGCSYETFVAFVQAGADLFSRCDSKRNLLHFAVRGNCCREILEELLEICLDWIDEKDDRGEIPLHSAQRPWVVSLLIAAGSDPWAVSRSDEKPLDQFFKVASYSRVGEALITEYIKNVDRNILLADRNKSGDSYLHTLIEYANVNEVIRILMEVGIDPKWKNEEGDTPVHLVFGRDSSKLKVLLKAHPSVATEGNNRGETPLVTWKRKFMKIKNIPEIDIGIHFRECVLQLLKYVALQNDNIARNCISGARGVPDERIIFDYLEKCIYDIKFLKHHAVAKDMNLHDLILQSYLVPSYTFLPLTSAAISYWKRFAEALQFSCDGLSVYEEETNQVLSFVMVSQLYGKRLAICRSEKNWVTLDVDSSIAVFDRMSFEELQTLSYAFQKI